MEVKTVYCPNCGERIKPGVKLCKTCGAELGGADNNKERVSHDDTMYLCPICSKSNKITETFHCPSCETEFLCLEHRIKRSTRHPETRKFVTEYYCTNCWKKYGFATFSD